MRLLYGLCCIALLFSCTTKDIEGWQERNEKATLEYHKTIVEKVDNYTGNYHLDRTVVKQDFSTLISDFCKDKTCLKMQFLARFREVTKEPSLLGTQPKPIKNIEPKDKISIEEGNLTLQVLRSSLTLNDEKTDDGLQVLGVLVPDNDNPIARIETEIILQFKEE